MFIYSDTDDKPTGFVPKFNIDPHPAYLKHAANWFYLRLIYSNGSTLDKFQATKELAICDRKLKYWSSKPTFNPDLVETEVKRLSKEWGLEFLAGKYDEVQDKWLKQLDTKSKSKPNKKQVKNRRK
jgi:hypothetical protein